MKNSGFIDSGFVKTCDEHVNDFFSFIEDFSFKYLCWVINGW